MKSSKWMVSSPDSDLRQILYVIFSRFGKVLEVKAKRNIRMRGQAFVTFEKTEDALKAQNELNRQKFFKKELVHLR
jgi:U2 small nuclear ribonucleoprotein B''